MAAPAGALTYKNLQDAVIENGFQESQRADVKNWINFRYGWILGLDEWTYRKQLAAVTVSASSAILAGVPSYFSVAVVLQLSDGTELRAMDWGDFQKRYFGTGIPAGSPEAFTVTNGVIYLGPTPAAADTGQLMYLSGVCHLDTNGALAAGPMSLDSDYPVIPAEHHLMLVHGAKATGFRLTNVPMSELLEADFSNGLTAMRANYLEDVRADTGSMPLDQIAYG